MSRKHPKTAAGSKRAGVRAEPAKAIVRGGAVGCSFETSGMAGSSAYLSSGGAVVLVLLAVIHLVWRVDPALLYQLAPPFFFEAAFVGQSLPYPGGPLHYLSAGVAQFHFRDWLGAVWFALLLSSLLLCARPIFACTMRRGATAAASALACLTATLPGRYQSDLAIPMLGLLLALAATNSWLWVPSRAAAGPLAAAWFLGLVLFYLGGTLPLLLFVALTVIIQLGVRRRPLLALGCALVACIPHAWWWLRPGYKPLADLETWGSGLTFGLVAAAWAFVPGWLLAQMLWRQRPAAQETEARHHNSRPGQIGDSTPWRWVLGLFAAIALLALTRDTSRHAAARIEYCSARQDWPGVLEAARSLETWSASSRLHLLRALAHSGRLPEDLFAFPLRRGDEVLPGYAAGLDMARALGQTLFELGQVNLAEHMAHETLELEGPRPDTLRLLADINWIKNRPEAARVFLSRLRLIPFHRAAAEGELLAAATDPGRTDRADLNLVRTRLVRTDEPDPWLAPEILLRQLLEANRTNRMALDYLLAHRLVREELPALVDDLTHRNAWRDSSLARPCEEALLALRESNPAAAEALRLLPSRPATAERYRQFREEAARFPGPSNAARTALAGDFGDTFWFYTLFGETAPVQMSRPIPGKP